MNFFVNAESNRFININEVKSGVRRKDGSGLWANSKCFMKDGAPWAIIIGELDYVRVPKGLWRNAMLKMADAGINTVSTCVFRNRHEEIEGSYDWTGNRNLREFIQTAADCGLFLWLGIGLQCPGGAQHGGSPERMLALPDTSSTIDAYFSLVEQWYAQVAAQVKGLLYDDGGPVIGILFRADCVVQGEGCGEARLNTLKNIAQKHGLNIPFYTTAVWLGNTVQTDEVIPAFEHYTEAPWTLVESILGEGVAHCDKTAVGETNAAPLDEYGQARPWLNYLRRMNLFLEANVETLAFSDKALPESSPNYTDKALRWFVGHCGDTGFVFVHNDQQHADTQTLTDVTFEIELSMRTVHLPVKPMTIPDGSGFAMPFNMVMGSAVLHHATCQPLATCGSTWFFYAPDGIATEFAFYEEGIAGIACNYAIRRKQNGLWLVDGLQPGRDCWFVVGCADGSTTSVCVLDERSSLMLHKYELTGGELLLMTDAQTWQDNGELVLTKRASTEFEVWTYPAVGVGGGWEEQMIGRNMRLSTSVPAAAAAIIRIEPVELTETRGKWNVTVAAELPPQVEELFLKIEYEGAKGALMLDGKPIADNSHDGRPWEVGIKRLLSGKNEISLELEILAISVDKDISIESDCRPQGSLFQLKSIMSEYEYRAVMPDFI